MWIEHIFPHSPTIVPETPVQPATLTAYLEPRGHLIRTLAVRKCLAQLCNWPAGARDNQRLPENH